jgi:hypothetical protein
MSRSTKGRTMPFVRWVVCLSVFAQREESTRQANKTKEKPIMTNQNQLIEQSPHEQWLAVREGHFNAAAEAYFSARPQLDSAVNRRIFYAGHCKGYDDRAHLEQPAEPAPTGDCRNCVGQGWEPSVYKGRVPCSFCQPAPSMAGDVPKIGCVQHDCAECRGRAALPAKDQS